MSSTSRIEVFARFRNSLVHYWSEEGLVFSRKNQVFLIRDLARPRPEVIARIPWRLSQQIAHIRFWDRLLKHAILQVHGTRDGRLLISNREAWWRSSGEESVAPVPRFSPTRPMNRGICESASGVTFVADYLPNLERTDPVRIHRTDDLLRFTTAWEFPRGEIRHVHGLIRDPEEENRIWVLTGDLDHESNIFFTDDEFQSLQLFLNPNFAKRPDQAACQSPFMIRP